MRSFYLLPFVLSPAVFAAGLYSKSSGVLNLDARSYEKLVAKSNYTSIVEFYAPWCGHCQKLQPAFEKVATALSGLARVGAVNCDEEANKPFCGSMDVKGFPTLKLVKPSKKPGGRGVVEDYNGERSAKAINDAVMDRIANHVARVKDDGLAAWLEKSPDRPKAIFFSDKGVAGALVKAVAIDFLASIDVAQIKSDQKEAVAKYEITSFPTLLLLPGADKAPIKHTGDMKKPSLVKFLSQAATPNPDATPEKEEPKPKKAPKKDKPKKAANGEKPSAPPTPKVESIKIETRSVPTESPDPKVDAESPPPVQLPVEPAPSLTTLADEDSLQKACLHTKSAICILAISPAGATASDQNSGEHPSLTSLRDIAHKHKQRGAKLFPIYAIPDTNAAGQTLVTALGVTATADGVEILAVNAKRGWWSRFSSEVVSRQAIDDWIDSIRFGEIIKEKIPEGLIKEIQEKVAEEQPKMEEPKVNIPLREQVMQHADRVLQFSDEGGQVEFVNVEDGHDEL